MPPGIEADHLGFDVTIYPIRGQVHLLVTDPITGRPINLMVLPPGNAENLAGELTVAANIAARQANPQHDMANHTGATPNVPQRDVQGDVSRETSRRLPGAKHCRICGAKPGGVCRDRLTGLPFMVLGVCVNHPERGEGE